jgi:hypothetical protein
VVGEILATANAKIQELYRTYEDQVQADAEVYTAQLVCDATFVFVMHFILFRCSFLLLLFRSFFVVVFLFVPVLIH